MNTATASLATWIIFALTYLGLAVGSFAFMFGPVEDASPGCSASLVVAGSTATIQQSQVCYIEASQTYITVTSGTFSASASGCNATISNFVGEIRENVGTPYEADYTDSLEGTCTRN